MYDKIQNKEVLFVVIEQTDDAGWILSRNLHAFKTEDEANFYAKKLKERNTDEDRWYDVEKLILWELA